MDLNQEKNGSISATKLQEIDQIIQEECTLVSTGQTEVKYKKSGFKYKDNTAEWSENGIYSNKGANSGTYSNIFYLFSTAKGCVQLKINLKA